jgi:hypothetical protein
MIDTSYAVPAEKQFRLPPQFVRITGRIEPLPKTPVPTKPTAPMRGDGGLYSTAEDYGRFVRMLLNGGMLDANRILRQSSVRLMGQNAIGELFVELQPDADKQRTKPFPLGAGKDKFGLGFQITADDPGLRGFRSPGSMSWAGMFNTEFWVDPVKHVGGVHMMQLLSTGPQPHPGFIEVFCEAVVYDRAVSLDKDREIGSRHALDAIADAADRRTRPDQRRCRSPPESLPEGRHRPAPRAACQQTQTDPFWASPSRQHLPFYDNGAIRSLRGFEQTVYSNLPPSELDEGELRTAEAKPRALSATRRARDAGRPLASAPTGAVSMERLLVLLRQAGTGL